jgi:hypothetical protein
MVRGGGKSYIYANFNPKYAQMAVTILRTYYKLLFNDENARKEEVNSFPTVRDNG